jgi:hypothetical protein
MPARDYGDLSRLALEASLDVDELRERLARMSDRQLLEFGHAAAYMCTPYANLGQPASAKAVRPAAPGGPQRVAEAARRDHSPAA